MLTDKLSPERHLNKITGQIYNPLRNIRVALTHLDDDVITNITVTTTGTQMEYAATVWSSHLKKDIRNIDRI